jgi:hypothetical protein
LVRESHNHAVHGGVGPQYEIIRNRTQFRSTHMPEFQPRAPRNMVV